MSEHPPHINVPGYSGPERRSVPREPEVDALPGRLGDLRVRLAGLGGPTPPERLPVLLIAIIALLVLILLAEVVGSVSGRQTSQGLERSVIENRAADRHACDQDNVERKAMRRSLTELARADREQLAGLGRGQTFRLRAESRAFARRLISRFPERPCAERFPSLDENGDGQIDEESRSVLGRVGAGA